VLLIKKARGSNASGFFNFLIFSDYPFNEQMFPLGQLPAIELPHFHRRTISWLIRPTVQKLK